MTDQEIIDHLKKCAADEDNGAMICRYAGKMLAISQARSAKLRAAAERIRVLGEECEAWRSWNSEMHSPLCRERAVAVNKARDNTDKERANG